MKLLIIFCTAPGAEPLLELLERAGVHGYTLIPAVLGAGATGVHLGTRAHPGTSSMVLVAVDELTANKLLGLLEAHRGQCAPDQGFHALQLSVERVLEGGAGA